jgi:hypothetical protein
MGSLYGHTTPIYPPKTGRARFGGPIAEKFSFAAAAPAVEVLGKDYEFTNKIEGFPAKLSDFKGLEINSFNTSDGVKLTYWEAGEGKPLIFIPGWSANGAEYVNVMFLLSRHYHVYVLDPRNQGSFSAGRFQNAISRFAMDLKRVR